MADRIDCDVAVLGAGPGGLAVAAGAVLMGAKTVLVERGRMGGESLNYGCIPSKALVSAARHTVAWRHAARLGINYDEPEIDFAAVMRHVKTTVAAIAPQDSIERFAALGVQVLQGEGRFADPDTLLVGDAMVKARRFVIATGSRPAIPMINGLADIAYLTNETIFDISERPVHLLVIGGGPTAIELGQAFRRLGSKVTIVEQARCLAQEDRELSTLLLNALRDEGVDIREQTQIIRAEMTVSGIVLTLRSSDGTEDRIAGSHLLIAAGRQPNVEDLALDKAGVFVTRTGITVDGRLRTANKKIYAIGDVTGLSPFTHAAGYHAGIVLKNALLRLPVRANHLTVPRVTYGDPELASIGLLEDQARARYGRVTILRSPFALNERAQAEARTEGLIKVIAGRTGRVLGVSIVGPGAGDLLQPWSLVFGKRLGLSAIQGMLVPYPSRGDASRRTAADFYKAWLFSPLARRLVQFLARFG
ncbi:FAD-dependent oxidoreductase [uncultured Ferrovibrio sp.]|jgi:pyruvate/2-oxoglutarate dehydrogenase complex dihydrolipoamide dehydrogenase (E3) component|uniref:dihydrolipoyl dehydrogenase family protein n=1 Tax=uncultured Ferrovibrio sp. TaxID=1576913 RepID=UPI00261241B8|nr:FAD-dependent oxidoreductase [uncultured Ferrovibrio sp.]